MPRVWVSVEAAVLLVKPTVDWQCCHVCGCRWRRLSCQSTAFESGSGTALWPRVWVSVEAAVLSVEPTVDRLQPRVWMLVEAAVLSVESTVDRLRPRVSMSVAAVVFSVGGVRAGQYIG